MVSRLLRSLGAAWLGSKLRDAAEGKLGPKAQQLFRAVADHSLLLGAVLAAATVAALSLKQDEVAVALFGAGSFLVSVGALSSTWQNTPPAWENDTWWRFLRDHGADVTLVVGGLTAKFTTCSVQTSEMLAKVHLTCGTALAAVTVAAALLAWLTGEAKLALPPDSNRVALQLEK